MIIKWRDQAMGGGLIAMLQLMATAAMVGGIKECTNTPTQLSSHTLRYELLNSENKSWREEVYSHYYHLNPSDDSLSAHLYIPRKKLQLQLQVQDHHHHGEQQQHHHHRHHHQLRAHNLAMKLSDDGPNFLRQVSLHDVRLNPESAQGRAQQTNLEYLLLLDVDRLLWSFRKTAGLPTPSTPYGGWESPDQELRGHFVGHFLSATAQMWASTHNEALNNKMSAVVDELNKCQKRMGTGYLSAFPPDFFDRFEAIQPVWAPYYTIHKILAGLVDQYTLAGNEQALNMATRMADYFYDRVQNVILKYSIERHWESLNEETGGMNDILYQLYSISGEKKQLVLAHLFDKPCFLGLLAVKADSLSGFHSNTHMPVVIGSQMRYEVTGDPIYKEIAMFFLDILNSSHTYATGGTSYGEHWVDPQRLASTLQTENEESCTTYNLLKVARNLFRWTKEMAYADLYERAILNGVLGIQRGTEPGVMIYMLPLGHGVSKAKTYHGWGTKFDSFWCCYGTAIESFSKLGDSIYFEGDDSSPNLYIIQFISSSIDWKSGQVMVNQSVDPISSSDPFLRLTLMITSKEDVNPPKSTLSMRIPSWTQSEEAVAAINGKNLSFPPPGDFLSVKRRWKSGDKLTFHLPVSVWTEKIKDDRLKYSSVQAILYGPYVLAGHSDGDWNITIGSAKSLSDWIFPIPAAYNSQLISLSQMWDGQALVLMRSKNNTFSMAAPPDFGAHTSVHVTYRLVLKNSSMRISSREDIIGKLVMIELFDQPGTLVTEQGVGESLTVSRRGSADDDWDDESTIFQVHDGLDGNGNTISLESRGKRGCFVTSGNNKHQLGIGLGSSSVKLMCMPRKHSSSESGGEGEGGGGSAMSFTLTQGMKEYNPVSFVAKGKERSFLLEPLMSFQDEYYNVYFNIH